MARPMPPVSPCAPWPCSGTSTPTGLVRAATTRRGAHRSTTSMASSITPTGSTTCASPPPWEGENYEPRNPMESETLKPGDRLIVSELSRLGRSLHQILQIVDRLIHQGIRLVAIKESISFEGKHNLQTQAMTALFGLF